MTVTPLQPHLAGRGPAGVPVQRGDRPDRGLATVTELSLEDLGVPSGPDAATSAIGAEALFISSLVDSGEYVPARWGVRDDQFHIQRPVHEFCLRHQTLAGCAPGVELLRKQFPRFPYTTGIRAKWASAEVAEAHRERVLRIASAKAAGHLASGEHDEAQTVWKTALDDARPTLTQGVSVLDVSAITAAESVERCPLPAGALNTYLQGITPGEVGMFAARTNVGKSWWLQLCLVAAAEAGWTTYGFSMEMPAFAYNERLHRIMLRKLWTRPWFELTHDVRAELLEEWAEGCNGGSIVIHDPSTLPRYDSNALAACEGERVLVAVDHIGLARTVTGLRAITDWRAAAEISNEHKEVALARHLAVVMAVQVNREGERSSMPGTAHLSQTDALGQDADWVVTMRKHGEQARKLHIPKARRVACGQTFYTRFSPATGDFGDISPEMAEQLKAASDEIDAQYS